MSSIFQTPCLNKFIIANWGRKRLFKLLVLLITHCQNVLWMRLNRFNSKLSTIIKLSCCITYIFNSFSQFKMF